MMVVVMMVVMWMLVKGDILLVGLIFVEVMLAT